MHNNHNICSRPNDNQGKGASWSDEQWRGAWHEKKEAKEETVPVSVLKGLLRVQQAATEDAEPPCKKSRHDDDDGVVLVPTGVKARSALGFAKHKMRDHERAVARRPMMVPVPMCGYMPMNNMMMGMPGNHMMMGMPTYHLPTEQEDDAELKET